MSTFIGISKKQVNLLEAPFRSNCHTTWPKGKPYNAYLSEHDRYSEESCRKVCISYNIMRLCNCLEMYKGTDIQKLLDANSVCVDYKEGTACRDKFVQNPGGITDACDCPKRCEEVTYKRSVSRVAWTQTLRSGGIDQEQATPLSNIVIYLQSAMVTAITEKEEMSAISALSNVGGFLNMFTGTSFLMIYEAFGIFVMWFYKVFSGYRRKERKLPFIESLNLKY
ncbi:amiloride-sensitive sodium channel subunit beta-like isoform X3 [Varroa jacobsoni]|uniref:Uncharacterized protein n=2 Tax=Varroa TaxID=62624 RepID=A0A7M7M7N8_VARDE|nr:amiloride-sensitive sodium channel subunit beta-like isoform X1 [Varroa destructor]XP_022710106.1 amiloride-sensitive sodium channel subunit beta-like isoform X3 [Varroa jacobsoni]XP_022710107.1 amiloride-sensitive sodium channel subunit beta-like isoform X3 [Varroa jacobsoni]XP_022710108.1 amiloride-sensitive sodium channel subunit beta-like isoform X3 [Varroa jacobsoni]XP_022710109.1 amiloride-sensitive sodium channel subunit beta-like isoform X3 [Varroa jacobsoni]